jgi:hypothetical protein
MDNCDFGIWIFIDRSPNVRESFVLALVYGVHFSRCVDTDIEDSVFVWSSDSKSRKIFVAVSHNAEDSTPEEDLLPLVGES